MTEGPVQLLMVNHVSVIGGAERSLLDLLKNLDAVRYRPVVAIPDDGPLAAAATVFAAGIESVPVRPIKRPHDLREWTRALGRVLRAVPAMARVIRRHRIRLVHSNSTAAQVYAGPAARLAGVPSLWHCRDLVPLGRMGHWLARTSTRIAAVSECVAAELTRYESRPGRLHVVRNGIDVDSLQAREPNDALRRDLETPESALVVTMVAQLVPWKNHRLFLETAARIAARRDDARFWIVGGDMLSDHPGYARELEAFSAQAGVRDRVTFTGQRDDAVDLIRASDVLLHPARREPFGRVITEAMALGTPVVAVHEAGPAEIMRHEMDGLLVAPDPDAMAQAVLRVAHDADFAQRLTDSARDRVARVFDIKRTMAELESIYEAMIGK